jgi:hypothetical protein
MIDCANEIGSVAEGYIEDELQERSMLPIPPELKDCLCFVCLRDRRREWKAAATGLFAAFPMQDLRGRTHRTQIVTSRHIIDDAKRLKLDVALRLNTEQGGVRFLETDKSSWLLSDLTSSDLAVLHADIPRGAQHFSLPPENFADEGFIRKYIHVRTEVFALSISTEQKGKRRNVAVLRAGTISCMPEEPLHGSSAREGEQAFVVELRAPGSLIGSPVFAFCRAHRMIRASVVSAPLVRGVIVVGFIRGRKDVGGQKECSSLPDREEDTMGIEAVTPVTELVPILAREILTRNRREDK